MQLRNCKKFDAPITILSGNPLWNAIENKILIKYANGSLLAVSFPLLIIKTNTKKEYEKENH
jgi:hypothetical protein